MSLCVVVVVRGEIAVIGGERKKIPFGSLDLVTDCGEMMERGNEVGSGYPNAYLSRGMETLLSMRDIKSYAAVPPFAGQYSRVPLSTTVPSRDFARGKPPYHIPPGIRGTLLLVNGNLLVQDFRHNPSRGIIVIISGIPDGVQVSSDRSRTKIRHPCMTSDIHKDV